MRRWVFLCAVLAACAGRRPREAGPEVQAILKDDPAVLPRPELRVERVQTELPADPGPYRLGVGDVLDIRVLNHPEFGTRPGVAQEKLVGFTIQEDGKAYLPLVGGLQASGRTVAEFRRDLLARLGDLVNEPQVMTNVLSYASQRFHILGAVDKPGTFAVDGRTRLLDGIGRAGGTKDGADLEGAYVVRGRTLLPVSLGDLLLRGDTSRNITMRDGDLVYVPPDVRWQVYVLGDVRRPGVVRMPQTGLNLAGALAGAGGLDLLHANRNKIRVFRGSWQAPRVFTLTIEDVLHFGHAIQLQPGDRIHVAPRALATWNRTLSLLLPIVQGAVTTKVLSE